MHAFRIDRLIDWFITPEVKASGEDALRRARLMVFSSFLFIGITFLNAVMHIIVGESIIAAIILLAASAVGYVLLMVVRSNGHYRILFHLYAFFLVLTVSTLSYMEGGFEAGTFMWILLIMTMGPYLVGIRATFVWATIVGSVLIFFYLFNTSSLAPRPTMVLSIETLRRLDFIVLMSLLIVTFLWSVAFEKLLARSMREKKVAERELRQAQRLESVGLLAGGIAHDFNNLLSVILTYTNMLYDELDKTDPRREEAFQIRMAGERAADIVRQLLQFSRKEMDQPERLDLNYILSDMKTLLQRSLGESIGLELSIGENLWNVNIDRRQIQQVLLNLAINARDAMPKGGRLDVKTTNIEVNITSSKKLGIQEGRYVKLVVRDTGHGMNEEVRSRVFEPFFTTKPLGKGTGLGLSTTYGIIRQACGAISVESTPGKGTEFSVVLPAYEGVATSAIPPKKEAVERSDKRYKVLLVEDDDGVREATRRVLSRAGFQMLSVRDSAEALRICRSHAGEIDVLLTDVVMPGMSGSKLAELAPKFQPQIAVVLMSGYADDEVVRYGLAHGRFTFVQKPFNQDELIKAIYKSVSQTKPVVIPPDERRPVTSFQC